MPCSPLYEPGCPVMAPIAGHTDIPFRRMVRKNGCRYAFTEMIDAGSLVFRNEKTLGLAERGKDEDFLGIQLVGSDLDQLEKAVEYINAHDFQVLDFNLGCPAPKVERKGEGIQLALKRPDVAIRAVECLVARSHIPVTVKTRIQSEEDPQPTVDFCRRLESAGVAGITIHGRVMRRFYAGPVFTGIISAVRENLDIPVVANGGVFNRTQYADLLRDTGCANGMIARGALGNPWVFREITDPSFDAPTVSEFADTMESYMEDMLECYGREFAYVVARKTILEFLKGRGYPGSLRASISFLNGPDSFHELMSAVRQGPAQRYFEMVAQQPDSMLRKLRMDD